MWATAQAIEVARAIDEIRWWQDKYNEQTKLPNMRRALEAVWSEPTFTNEELVALEVALYDRREALAAIDHRHFMLPAVCSAYRKAKKARANGS